MANPEQLKILKHSVPDWNEWRMQNPTLAPDLRLADLTEAYLAGANLSMGDLSGASLRRTHASLADFGGANLRGADLSSAHLTMAKFKYADLTGADLSGVWLSRADLSAAKLAGAKFNEAGFQDVMLGDVDLSEAVGLETVNHREPSTIGIDTIYRSHGKIPEEFLRGCGVPEDFIVYMKSLVGKPIEFYSCFISHSSQDDDFARRIYADLRANNIRCWFAPEDLKIGDKFRTRIDEAIRIHDKLLLVLSQNSVLSAWVEKEVEAAFEKEQRSNTCTVLFPIRLDDAVMETDQAWAADIRRTRHIGDFRKWKNHEAYQEAFDKLLRDLKADNSPK